MRTILVKLLSDFMIKFSRKPELTSNEEGEEEEEGRGKMRRSKSCIWEPCINKRKQYY